MITIFILHNTTMMLILRINNSCYLSFKRNQSQDQVLLPAVFPSLEFLPLLPVGEDTLVGFVCSRNQLREYPIKNKTTY